MPYFLMKSLLKSNVMPNTKKIIERGKMKEINSVYPVISSVAWTSYATGVNPGEHGIYGFVDRKSNPFELLIPTSRDRKKEPIWKVLSNEGKKVTVINVPITYPVEEVNGRIVSCFLCPDIKKGTYPVELAESLEKIGYIIDPNAWIARSDKQEFFNQIMKALEKRFEVAMNMIEEDWDYFQLHIMETDRHMHFFWDSIQDTEHKFHEQTMLFYEKLDQYIGEIFKKLNENDTIVALSDHGFCGIKKEVQLNEWMVQEGFLKIDENTTDLLKLHSNSVAYSLLPGRIYINLEGREEKGTVSEADYFQICEHIKESLLEFRDPETNENIISKVLMRDEIYNGAVTTDAPDLIAHPCNGYDLKGFAPNRELFAHSALCGMHTYDNAMVLGINFDVDEIQSICDIYNQILRWAKL
jgi:predicted AlkP superfamily phosphohydrolase/phosphomutase